MLVIYIQIENLCELRAKFLADDWLFICQYKETQKSWSESSKWFSYAKLLHTSSALNLIFINVHALVLLWF